MENFSLVSSHNLLENPLLFPTEITNLLFVIKNRQPLKQNFMLNCKKIPLFWRFSFQIKTTDFWTIPSLPSKI